MAEIDWPVGQDETGKVLFSKVRTTQASLPFLLLSRQGERPPVQSEKPDELLEKLQEAVVKPLEDRLKKAEEDAKEAKKQADQARVDEANRRAEDARKELNETKQYVKEVEGKVEEARRGANIEGYRSDSFKLVGQTAGDIANMVKERKPLKEIMDVLFPKAAPPPSAAPLAPEAVVSETAAAEAAGVIVKADS